MRVDDSMELIRGQHNLRPRHRHCVATIGNFDGVHLGHQAILHQLAVHAEQMGLPGVVITFEPQPREFFAPQTAPPRLMSLREKLLALAEQGVKRVLCLRFNDSLANVSAQHFIERLLVDQLGIRYLAVGDDFRFGHNRQGDFNLLCQEGIRWGFQVTNTHSYLVEGERVSSTRIRQALQASQLSLADRLLGRPYAIGGRVAHGQRLGRKLGWPTANIALRRLAVPLAGVYAVTVEGIGSALSPLPLPGVANVGRRPTLGGVSERLEVHILDFEGDIYGCYLRVNFLHFLRPEQQFETLKTLQQQIAQDVQQARLFFADPDTLGAQRYG